MRLSPRRQDEAIREQGLQGLLLDLDCLFRRIMVCYDIIATSYGMVLEGAMWLSMVAAGSHHVGIVSQT